MKKHKLTIMPSGRVIEVEDGDTLFKAFQDNDIYVKTTCGGFGRCGNCKIKVLSDPKDCLTEISFQEKQLLGNVFHITKERLACQTRMIGDATVDNSSHQKAFEESEKIIRSKVMRRKKEDHSDKHETGLQEPQPQDAEWFEHWKKEKDQDTRAHKKKLGGNKRPRFFNSENPSPVRQDSQENQDFRKIRTDKKDEE